MGLSGSGKSTLIRMLNRLIDPTGGDLHVKRQGRFPASARPRLRDTGKHIAMVFQSVALLPNRTVIEERRLRAGGAGVAKAERLAAAGRRCAKVGLGDWMQHLPRASCRAGPAAAIRRLARALTSDPEIIPGTSVPAPSIR